MKLLFLSSYYPPQTRGGAEISTQYLAQALSRRGHDVTVVTYGKHATQERFEGVSVWRLPLPFTAKPLFERQHSQRVSRALLRLVGDLRAYDMVHAHDFRMIEVAAELPLGRRVITVRDYAAICGTTNSVLHDGTIKPVRTLRDAWQSQRLREASWQRVPFRLWQYLYNLEYRAQAFAAADTHVYISQAQRELIVRYQATAPQYSSVIYNPVGENFLTTPVQRPIQKQQVLYVGTVEEYKGVGVLIAAFKKVASEFPHAQLMIVGEGAQKSQYEQDVAHAGLSYKVHFRDRVPVTRLLALYDEADVVVAPHVWIEPFGRTVAEAMARQKIVVAANCGGPAEMITEGKNGVLFSRGSVTALHDALRRVFSLKDIDRRALAAAAREWVQAHLQDDTIASQYESVYQQARHSEVYTKRLQT